MALVEERVSSPRPTSHDERPELFLSLRLEPLLYVALIALGLLLRVHDLGTRALHHDESLHALYSWYLYVGRGYVHDPMMHGPFQFHWTALIYFLFGDSDFTARLAPALFGTALIGLPYFLRHELGRSGALIAAALLAISPSFLYFSRFARNDIYIAVWTMLMLVGLFGFLRTRHLRYLFLLAAATALSYATKEVTFITGFIGVTFVGLAVLLPRTRSHVLPALRSVPVGAWLGAAGLFAAINLVLYTTFFTNPRGLCTAVYAVQPFCEGTRGALDYWLDQHEVQRGGQPVYYYAMLLALYEFLPVVLAAVGLVALRAASAWQTASNRLFFWFLVYWSVVAFVIYSQAGEKMPWLLLHVALPLVLLGSLWLGRVAQRLHWRALWSWQALVAFFLALFLVASAVAWVGLSSAAAQSPLEAQTAWLRRVGLAVVLAATVGAVAYLWSRYGRAIVLPSVLAGFALVGLFFYVRAAWTVTYVNADVPAEPLIYVQSSPDVPWIVQQIEHIGFQYGQGRNVGILMDNGWGDGVHESVAWPFEWYLRDYTNRRYFSRTIPPDVDTAAYPVLLVMATNVDPILPVLADYHGQRYRLNWWFPERYKAFDASPRLGPLTIPWLRWDLLLAHLADPAARSDLLSFFVYRDTPSGGAREFFFYVRNDVPALGPAPFDPTLAAPADRDTIAQPGPDNTTVYGRTADGRSALGDPKHVAVDHDGRVYVVEARTHRVTVFHPDGTVAASWGSRGTGDGQFNEPWGIALAPNGDVYVADTWNHRVQRFDRDGRFLGQWGRVFFDPDRPLDQELGGFYGPRDVVVDAEGNVYVTDTGNKRIQMFDPEGRPLRAFGRDGDGPGEFREPVGLALDADGNLLVADTWNGRVQRLTPEGEFIDAYPLDGWEDTSVVNKPYLASVDGQVVVTQPAAGRVLRLAEDGQWQPVLVPGLQLPTGVAADPEGNLYVSDSRAGTITRVPAR